MLTLLTMTGCRPFAFELCKRWMAAQDYIGKVRWLIVDDGETRQDTTDVRTDWYVEHLRRAPYWQPGQNTQADNILFGLAHHDGGPLVIIEDDDHYAPGYLTAVAEWLGKADLVGERSSRYYHVGVRRWYDNQNMRHASLCSTAMKGDAVEAFRKATETRDKFIDMILWREFKGPRLLADTRLTVGIKGLPGRPGIGMGHKPVKGQFDTHGHTLKSWIGKAAEAYLDANPSA